MLGVRITFNKPPASPVSAAGTLPMTALLLGS
jgi:hypothetical protein